MLGEETGHSQPGIQLQQVADPILQGSNHPSHASLVTSSDCVAFETLYVLFLHKFMNKRKVSSIGLELWSMGLWSKNTSNRALQVGYESFENHYIFLIWNELN